jgi:predicted HNH restriction endonuclease
LYERDGWQFYSMFWPNQIEANKHNQALAAEMTTFFTAVVRAIAGVTAEEPARPYPGFKNRARVQEHLRRERSAALARRARVRDKFTCSVCGINFGELYGTVGRGFAEVHHLVPLASKHSPKITHVEDLATVCANCHRMLHRMSGKGEDLGRLKKLFTGHWPTALSREKGSR